MNEITSKRNRYLSLHMISFGSLVRPRTCHAVVLVALRRSYALKTDVTIAYESFRYFHIVSAIAFATSISTFSSIKHSNRFLWGYIRGKGSGRLASIVVVSKFYF